MKKRLTALSLLTTFTILFSGCAPFAEATQEAMTETKEPHPTAAATEKPTNTPRPIAADTATPGPIVLKGSGDSIVDLQKWRGPAILKVKHTGEGSFALRNYPANSEANYELLVDTTGSYEGTLPLDFVDNQHTARFKVIAAGSWEIQVLPFERITIVNIPATVEGNGDFVFAWILGTPDRLNVDASQASSTFGIFAIGGTHGNLLVKENAPYTGTVSLPPSAWILVVKATGPWVLEITAK